MDQVAAWWIAQRGTYSGQLLPAEQRYVGRGFADAKRAAQRVNGPLFVVSAGMGLIPADFATPDYDLTTERGPHSVKSRVSKASWSPGEWWRAITDASGCLAELAERVQGKVLIAVSAPYLQMIQPDLLNVAGNARIRCRLFTSPAGAKNLSDTLARVAMPYDTRIDGVGSAYTGTLSDFPQRALLHFVEAGWATTPTTPEEDKQHVDKALRAFQPKPRIRRPQLSDEELLSLLSENRGKLRASGKAPLRFVRDDLGIACEQGRFSRLYKRFKDRSLSKEIV